MNYKKHFLLLAAAILAAGLIGCNTDPDTHENWSAKPLTPFADGADGDALSPTHPAPTATAAATDYSDRSNWGRFTEANNLTRDADIFILPGMASVDASLTYAPITHSGMRSGVNSFVTQVNGIAGSHANIYAPYYRQANAFSAGVGFYSGDARDDIIAAFEYYYNTINKGNRPFILFGFSQGAAVLWEFTCDYMQRPENEAVAKNHVITYAIGAPSSRRNLINANSQLKFSQSYNDIHVLVHYNTYVDTDTSCTNLSGAGRNNAVTNPISWTTDEEWYPVSHNPHLANTTSFTAARVHRRTGILIVRGHQTTAEPCGGFMGLHGQDIPFFRNSITANIGDRIAAWKAAYSGTSVREPERVIR